jgi:hypothetical protein
MLWKKSLVFNFRFADQHHWDVIANRVHAAALAALQSLSAFGQIHGRFAQRANENLQEFRVYGHSAEDVTTSVVLHSSSCEIQLMRNIRLALLCFFILLAPTRSGATTVERLGLDDLVEKADKIVAGKVSGSRTFWSADRKLIYTAYTIEVHETIKGEGSRSVEITTVGGQIGNLILHVSGMPSFEKGEDTVVFVESAGGRWTVVGLNQGKFTISNGEVSNSVTDLSFPDGIPGRALKMPVEQFKSRIRRLVDR